MDCFFPAIHASSTDRCLDQCGINPRNRLGFHLSGAHSVFSARRSCPRRTTGRCVSFLTLMGKRDVLYFRGQRAHFDSCLPVLFREEWSCDKHRFRLSPGNRGKYYALLRELRGGVLLVARQVGMPRTYILEHIPAAAASVLQHYELWPPHFIDVTRSLPTAVAFVEGVGDQEHAYLYVFAMPDLRGSITSVPCRA